MGTPKLRRGERCPVHGSFFCCGREGSRPLHPQAPRVQKPKPPNKRVQRIDDPHHPRGYREICSLAELRDRKNKMISQRVYEGKLLCVYCHGSFADPLTGEIYYRNIELCHLIPKGMGGATHDDHWENLALGHRSCNFENGSKRMASA